MIKRIKEYLEYRKNVRIAKKEMANLAATTLPFIRVALDSFKEDNGRVIEVFKYMATLTPEDIQKILVHSVVETMPDSKED